MAIGYTLIANFKLELADHLIHGYRNQYECVVRLVSSLEEELPDQRSLLEAPDRDRGYEWSLCSVRPRLPGRGRCVDEPFELLFEEFVEQPVWRKELCELVEGQMRLAIGLERIAIVNGLFAGGADLGLPLGIDAVSRSATR